ncbi:MAG: hypothetical protein GY952_19730 [Rhodobacteraceae bacterium]|nr:hypothetical protein [Paracoccaceae bacterium]
MYANKYSQYIVTAEKDTPRILAATPEMAQALVNFTILRPRFVPADVRMTESSVRLESPPDETDTVERGQRPPDWTSANTCSYLSRFEGDGRSFRLKQFFYDWAPPACDHPPLWNSKVRAVPSVPPFVCWIGTDFLDRAGATSRINRTSVEMSVTNGSFTDEEIACIFSGLDTACPQYARMLDDVCSAQLNYWSRHDLPIVDVPYGLFQIRRSDHAERCKWLPGAVHLSGFAQPRIHEKFGFVLDSTGIFGNENTRELELVFAAPPAKGREVRMIIQRSDRGRIAWPPKPSTHPAAGEAVEIDGNEVHLRFIDVGVGPFAAVFKAAGMRVMVLTSSAYGQDRAWFHDLLSTLIWTSDT